MGILLDKIDEVNLKFGNDIPTIYKNNSVYIYEKLKNSDDEVSQIPFSSIQPGRFYFFNYLDDSNWMKYSFVFLIDFKKFRNLIILRAVNFNFIPLEIRTIVFDKFFSEINFEKNLPLDVNFNDVYSVLKRAGFEYSICEYNLSQMKLCYIISMNVLPRFIYSGYPVNKYDPLKLYSIWSSKLKNQEKRDNQISKSLISDFYDLKEGIDDNYNSLKGHITRIQNSLKKYG